MNYAELADIFGIEESEMLSHVLYRNITGAVAEQKDERITWKRNKD